MTLVRLPIPPTIFMLLRDLDLIKVKLLEEVEGPYKHKCDVLAQVRYAPVLPSAAHAYLVWGILKEQHIGAFQKSISKEHLGHFKRAAHWGISKEHFKRAFGAFQKSIWGISKEQHIGALQKSSVAARQLLPGSCSTSYAGAILVDVLCQWPDCRCRRQRWPSKALCDCGVSMRSCWSSTRTWCGALRQAKHSIVALRGSTLSLAVLASSVACAK